MKSNIEIIDLGNNTYWIRPRIATAEDINEALLKMAEDDPSIFIGRFSGFNWVKDK